MRTSCPIQSIANDKLVLDFFSMFSRFECGLKRAGFVKKGPYGSAGTDWEKFGNAVDGQLITASAAPFIGAKNYLLQEPPKLQKI